MGIHALQREAVARAIFDWDAPNNITAVRKLIEAHFKDTGWYIRRLSEYHLPGVLLWVATMWHSDHRERGGGIGMIDIREVVIFWDTDLRDFQLEEPIQP